MKNAGDFIEFIRPLIRVREKEKVRKLINFKFKRHHNKKYNSKKEADMTTIPTRPFVYLV